MSLWDNMKKAAAKAGNAAMVAGHKTRLHGEILLVDRDIKGRKQQFGIDLYNHVGPLANSPDFFAADDPLTATLRPPLLTAQREIAALGIRRNKIKEDIKQAEVKRAAAFPDKAITFADKAKNAARSAALAGNEAKLATDLSVVESQIKHFKQLFGEDIYDIFVDLEDNKGWLPTDRTIRSMYDKARQDVEKLSKKRADKLSELEGLGGSYNFDKKKQDAENMSYDAPAVPTTPAPASTTPVPGNPQQHGMFATSMPSSSPAPEMTPSYTAQSGMFAAPVPAASPPALPSTNYQAPSAPISQAGSYMQSNMRVSQAPSAPAGGGGYSDNLSMGGYTDSSPMGGYSGGQAPMGGAMGGFSDQPAAMEGFSDFSGLSGAGGGNGFQQQQQQQPSYNMGGFQQDAFGSFSNTQNGTTSNQQNSSGKPNNDLLLF